MTTIRVACLLSIGALSPCSHGQGDQAATPQLREAAAPRPPAVVREPEALLGAWRQLQGDRVLHFDSQRCVTSNDGRYSVHLLAVEEQALVRRTAYTGFAVDERLELVDGQLVITPSEGGNPARFRRLDTVPAGLKLEPYELGQRTPSQEELAELEYEFADRHEADQEARARFGKLMEAERERGGLTNQEERERFNRRQDVMDVMGEMVREDRGNTERILELLADVGWIDAQRFGIEMNNTAFLIVQHSGNLRLMKTVLPLIEEEARARPSLQQSFALLHDRTMLSLGEKQRYGTQLLQNAEGRMALRRVEDLEKLDELRAEMGLVPIATYLSWFEAENGVIPIEED